MPTSLPFLLALFSAAPSLDCPLAKLSAAALFFSVPCVGVLAFKALFALSLLALAFSSLALSSESSPSPPLLFPFDPNNFEAFLSAPNVIAPAAAISPIVPIDDCALKIALIIFSPWNKKSTHIKKNIQFPDC